MSSYLGQAPGLGEAERFIFTATSVTDTVTVDDNGILINYTVGQISVYLNGVKQVIGDDIETPMNGSSIVFASNFAVGDVIEAIALSTFSPANTVPATGGSFTGNVNGTNLTLSGNLTVNGTTVTIDAETLVVEDKNIEIASVDTPSDTTCEGAGLTIKGGTIQSTYHNSADKTFTWTDGNDEMSFVSSHKIAENKGSSAWQRPLTTQLGLS